MGKSTSKGSGGVPTDPETRRPADVPEFGPEPGTVAAPDGPGQTPRSAGQGEGLLVPKPKPGPGM